MKLLILTPCRPSDYASLIRLAFPPRNPRHPPISANWLTIITTGAINNYPVFSSDAGLHTWDNKLTDYSLSAVLARRLHVKEAAGKSARHAHCKLEQGRSHRLAVVSCPT